MIRLLCVFCALFCITILGGVACNQNPLSNSPPGENKKPEVVERTNGIFYLELSGTPEEMGRRHGTLLKKEIQNQVTAYRKQVLDDFGKENGKRIIEYVTKKSGFLNDIEKHLPDVYEEMKGIAKGADLEIDDILLINMYEEVFEGAPQTLNIKPLPKEPQGKCTTLNCFGRKGLPNLNAQNLDYTENLNGAQLMIHYTSPRGLKILLYTFAGQVGGIGANSKGLSMMCNTLPAGSKRKNDGLGSAFTTRGILEQGSIAEAIQWLEMIPHYGAYNYSLMDSSDACMIEYSPKTKKVVRLEIPKDKGYLAHANHVHKLNDRNEVPDSTDKNGNPIGSAFGETLARQQKADELLSGKGTTANVDYLKKVLATAPVNNKSADWVTLQSIIVVHDPANLRIYASAGNEEKRHWNEYKFK